MRRSRRLILALITPLLAGCSTLGRPSATPVSGTTAMRSAVGRNLEEALVAWIANDPDILKLSDTAFEQLLRRQALVLEATDLTPAEQAAFFDRLRQVRRGAMAKHAAKGQAGPS